ncbi:hypothetical protein CROQUDRAFT_678624 [Cronartium quercuum f. sp. fusiforme G11]|uniref:Uncharacterized protein n=1 Tax=Cronartium quercuum f. sp. fusiforme G11 TaxID=708437 RepID=A0A9P6T8T6_9BASI|nr:hypothetical protein CROQUDRAFT_678624 [Cronartium quercuum f. sp. fusiforme G11]
MPWTKTKATMILLGSFWSFSTVFCSLERSFQASSRIHGLDEISGSYVEPESRLFNGNGVINTPQSRSPRIVEYQFGIVVPPGRQSHESDRVQESTALHDKITLNRWPYNYQVPGLIHQFNNLGEATQTPDNSSRKLKQILPSSISGKKRNHGNLIDTQEFYDTKRHEYLKSKDDQYDDTDGSELTELTLWPKSSAFIHSQGSERQKSVVPTFETQGHEYCLPHPAMIIKTSERALKNTGQPSSLSSGLQQHIRNQALQATGPHPSHPLDVPVDFPIREFVCSTLPEQFPCTSQSREPRDMNINFLRRNFQGIGSRDIFAPNNPLDPGILAGYLKEIQYRDQGGHGRNDALTSLDPLKGPRPVVSQKEPITTQESSEGRAKKPGSVVVPQNKLKNGQQRTQLYICLQNMAQNWKKCKMGKMEEVPMPINTITLNEPSTHTSTATQTPQIQDLPFYPEINFDQPYTRWHLTLTKTSWTFIRTSNFEKESSRLQQSLELYKLNQGRVVRLLARLWRVQEVAAKHLNRCEDKLDFQIVAFEFLASLILSQNFITYRLQKDHKHLTRKARNEYYKLFRFLHTSVRIQKTEDEVLLEVMYGSLKYWEKERKETILREIRREVLIQQISDQFLIPKDFRNPNKLQTMEMGEKTWSFEPPFPCTEQNWKEEINRLQLSMSSWGNKERERVKTLFLELWNAQGAIADYLEIPTRASELRVNAFECLASLILTDKASIIERQMNWIKPFSRIKNDYFRLSWYIQSTSCHKTLFKVLSDVIYSSLVYWRNNFGDRVFTNISKDAILSCIQHHLPRNM